MLADHGNESISGNAPIHVSPSGLDHVDICGPAAHAAGRDLSPSGLDHVGICGPAAHAAGRDLSPSGL